MRPDSSIALPRVYSKYAYFVMTSKEEFTAGVAFALSRSTWCSDGSSWKCSKMFTRAVTWSYGSLLHGYWKSVCYQLLPYMFDMRFRRASAPPTKPWTSYIYSAFFIGILITVCYTVRYPDDTAHAHKYTYSKYQASLLSLEAWDRG